MNITKRKEIYKKLEEQNGRTNQIIKAIEEMSELIKELTKMLGKDTYTSNKNICEEIADAKICIEQLELFVSSGNVINMIMDYKLKRLEMFYIKETPPLPHVHFIEESGQLTEEIFKGIKPNKPWPHK